MPRYNDIQGEKIGRLTVLRKGNGRKTSGGNHVTTWICRCDCGAIKEIDYQKLKNRTTLSCGCLRNEKVFNVNFVDLVGQKYNRLTFIRYLEEGERKTNGYNWICKCDCGNFIHANASKVKSGHTKSCGCLEKEFVENINKKYKYRDKRLYGIFRAMISRCSDKNNRRYNDYGGRGITVCPEWTKELGFDDFAEWAYSSGYTESLTIDRIDNDKGYSPDNCRWITNKKQQNNKRHHRYAEYNGETHTLAEWSDMLKIPYSRLYCSIVRQNKDIKEIIDNYTA